MEYSTLRLERSGAVATVTLHKPEVLHALDSQSFNELEHVVSVLKNDPAVRVLLITGSGDRAFAAGADIRALLATDTDSGRAVSERGQQVFQQIESSGLVTIACINGVALGGGLELALACTLRVAANTAKFGLPEARLGLIPGYGGTQRLPRLIGRSAALRLMLTAAVIDAAEALRLGLVGEVIPAAELMSHTQRLAETIASLAPKAIQGILEAVRRGQDLPLQSGLEIEAELFGALCGTEDKREGLTAFLEKRPASWQNC